MGSVVGERRAQLALRATVALGLSAMLAGCGGGGGARVSGAALFATHCETCHSLSGTATPRQQGGDLKNFHLPPDILLQLTAEMPPLHGRLTERELEVVVRYVESVERR